MKKISRKTKKNIIIALTISLVLLLCLYFYQTRWIHEESCLTPDYLLPKQNITCKETLGWITKSDRVSAGEAPQFVDLQPGDILLTLSTHTLGWRHGHAGLVVDADTVLECMTLGNDSEMASVKHWSTYSDFAVLRVKDVTPEIQAQVVEYAMKHLCGVPYRLSAGFIGEKASDTKEAWFGLQCAYLVWYAWKQFGYDLDSDGGRLVTAKDLLQSPQLEVVQIYGMDPNAFLTR